MRWWIEQSYQVDQHKTCRITNSPNTHLIHVLSFLHCPVPGESASVGSVPDSLAATQVSLSTQFNFEEQQVSDESYMGVLISSGRPPHSRLEESTVQSFLHADDKNNEQYSVRMLNRMAYNHISGYFKARTISTIVHIPQIRWCIYIFTLLDTQVLVKPGV